MLINSGGFTVTDNQKIFELPDKSVTMLITGIGCIPVIYNLTRHIQNNHYDRVIHAGIAGSFFLPLQPPEVVQVTRDTFADYGIDHGGIFRWIFHEGLWNPDEKPFRNGWMEVPADPALRLEKVSSITVDLVTGSPERKNRLVEKFNPQIETMEGAAVFYVCLLADIPVIQIRGISNYTGTRDRYNWKMEEAIEAMTPILLNYL